MLTIYKILNMAIWLLVFCTYQIIVFRTCMYYLYWPIRLYFRVNVQGLALEKMKLQIIKYDERERRTTFVERRQLVSYIKANSATTTERLTTLGKLRMDNRNLTDENNNKKSEDPWWNIWSMKCNFQRIHSTC